MEPELPCSKDAYHYCFMASQRRGSQREQGLKLTGADRILCQTGFCAKLILSQKLTMLKIVRELQGTVNRKG